jgi:Raf kinase inhibitor-like YbhB/YbcL family protein
MFTTIKEAVMRKCLILLLTVILLLTGCAQNDGQPAAPPEVTPAPLELTSPNFNAGAAIPALFTCQGADLSPALRWSEPPAGTQSLALIVDDPDAPVGTWVHWVVYNIPPDARELPQSASQAGAAEYNLPPGTLQGSTSFKRSDYGGPCPPSGTHRYFFRLYALDIPLDQPNLDKAALLKAMQGHTLAVGELMGTYQQE